MGKVPVLEGEDTSALHYIPPDASLSVQHREQRSLGINSSAPGPQCLLGLGPSPQSALAHSLSQHGVNTDSRRLVKLYNRMVISVHFHQEHHSTLKAYISLLRTGVFSMT